MTTGPEKTLKNRAMWVPSEMIGIGPDNPLITPILTISGDIKIKQIVTKTYATGVDLKLMQM